MNHNTMVSESTRTVHTTGRFRIGLFLAIALALIVGVLVGAGAAVLPKPGCMARGVTVYDVGIGGMTRAQASATLSRAAAEVTGQSLALRAGGHERKVRLHELGVQTHIQAALAAAMHIGHEQALLTRLISAGRARWVGVHLRLDFSMNDRQARNVLTAFAGTINRPPADATATWNGDHIAVQPGHIGAKLDQPASLKLLHVTILSALASRHPLVDSLELPYREKAPHITAEALAPVDTILGSFSTSYTTSSASRAKNVELAAHAISGVILLPGERFSFNETVGQRTAAHGYRLAPVIVDGQLQPGLGGGICQVSTTLYNAVLLANLQVVMRNHHSMPSHYVKPGLDATVSYGSLDLRFRNSTDAPIVIETVAQGRRLLVRLLGKGPAPTVRILRSGIVSLPGRTITKQDPTLPKGTRMVEQKGSGGLAVTVTRVVGSGEGAKREQLSRDRYPGEPTIIRVGTGAVNPATSDAVPPLSTESSPQ